jgi:hypothetical protein
MSNSGNSIKNEAVRELASAAITNAYQVLGGVFTRDAFRLWITNASNGDIYLSTDGVTNHMKIPAGTARASDDKTNDIFRAKTTQFYIKYAVVPGVPSGWVAIECEYC